MEQFNNLASGKPLPRYKGVPIYTPGQRALGAALIALPCHPLDEGKPDYLVTLLARFDNVSDQVLATVASEIDELTECGLRVQPRYAALAAMIRAALTMDCALAGLMRARWARTRPRGIRPE